MLLLFPSSAPTVIPGFVLTIDGVEKKMLRDWEIHATANGRSVMRFRVIGFDYNAEPATVSGGFLLSLVFMQAVSVGGETTYRPSLDEEVIFMEDGEVLFGGLIEGLSEAGVGDVGLEKIVTTVIARDFNTLATRRYFSGTIPAGTLRDALEDVVAYIPGGVVLDPAQVAGPSLTGMHFDDVKVDEVLNYLTTLTGYIWEITPNKLLRMYIPGTLTAPFNITVPNSKAIGDVTVEPTRQDYANRVIVRTGRHRKQADDLVEQAERDVWEVLVAAPDDTPEAAAQALADSYLARSTPMLKKLKYRTREKGVLPGQTQIVNLPTRNVNNTFLINDVVMRPLGDVSSILREVTATEGLVYQTGWRETYKRWNGSAATVAGAVGFGGTLNERNVYPLGGSGVEFVTSPLPDWVPVQGGTIPGSGSVQVQVNTAARGTTSALVTVRLRAMHAGISVKARLFDVTDSVAVPGESASVVSTDWQTVTFAVTLTPGSHFYELQLLPGAANEPVAGAGGYLE